MEVPSRICCQKATVAKRRLEGLNSIKIPQAKFKCQGTKMYLTSHTCTLICIGVLLGKFQNC